MSNRRFEMYEYRQIIGLMRQGERDRSIARAGFAGRKKIKGIRQIAAQQGWLNPEVSLPDNQELAKLLNGAAKSSRPIIHASSVLPYEKKIVDWHQQGIQTTTIHAALQREHGFSGSYFSVQRFVKKLEEQTPPATTTVLEFKPGECAQVDFGAGPRIVDEETGETLPTWIFVMVLAWSRHQYAEIVRRQDVITWLGCHRRALEFFGGVPSKILVDNCKCAITRACYHDPEVQRAYGEFAEGYGFMISACPPYDPQKKGRVESGVKYVKNNFIPLREFRNLASSNRELMHWVLTVAGNRIHGSTYEKPLIRFEIEKKLLKPLPEKPVELACWAKVKVHGDCHIQFAKCRYSVPYQRVHQALWLRAGETSIRIYHDHELVAIHARLFRPGSLTTLQEHLPPNALAYAMHNPQWCLKKSCEVGVYCEQVVRALFDDAVVDRLRAVQGILHLQNKYGASRLDAACRRAMAFHSPYYRTIKTMLANGLEYGPLPVEEVFDTLAETYTGKGRYGRNTSTLLQ